MQNNSQIIIYQTEDGKTKLDELFGNSEQFILKIIKQIEISKKSKKD
jgi:predicted dithiol-disulfide oxidoreductase (DUF899 family)